MIVNAECGMAAKILTELRKKLNVRICYVWDQRHTTEELRMKFMTVNICVRLIASRRKAKHAARVCAAHSRAPDGQGTKTKKAENDRHTSK